MRIRKTPRELATIFVEHAHAATAPELAKTSAAFVAMLAEAGLLVKWREIEREMHNVWKKKFGASQVSIVSAHPLSAEAESMLSKVVNGADVTARVDERLMAGAIIRIDDRRIDGSLAGRITRLKNALLS